MNRISNLQPRTAFVPIPADVVTQAFSIDWERTEELYREAYEQALAVVRPPIADRLAPYWN
jgi:hypothetical protein